MLSYEFSQLTNIVTLVLEEIKSVHSSEAELQEVVIQGFLRDTHQACGVFERVPDCFPIAEVDTIVELSPKRHSLHNISNLSFLCSFVIVDAVFVSLSFFLLIRNILILIITGLRECLLELR